MSAVEVIEIAREIGANCLAEAKRSEHIAAELARWRIDWERLNAAIARLDEEASE